MGGKTTIFERHFSPKVLSELWGFSTDTIYKWFRDEEGVLKAREGDTGDIRSLIATNSLLFSEPA